MGSIMDSVRLLLATALVCSLSGCIESGEPTQGTGLTAFHAVYEDASFQKIHVDLSFQDEIVDSKGHAMSAYRLAIYENEPRQATVFYLNQSLQVVRQDALCTDGFNPCRYTGLVYPRGTHPSPLGVGWPIRLDGPVFEERDWPSHAIIERHEEDDGTHWEVARHDPKSQGLWSLEGTYTYAAKQWVPQKIHAKVLHSGDAKNLTLRSIEYGAPLPDVSQWLPIKADPLTDNIAYFGDDRPLGNLSYSIQGAIDYLRSESESAREILERGGCVQYIEQSFMGTSSQALVSVPGGESPEPLQIILGDAAGAVRYNLQYGHALIDLSDGEGSFALNSESEPFSGFSCDPRPIATTTIDLNGLLEVFNGLSRAHDIHGVVLTSDGETPDGEPWGHSSIHYLMRPEHVQLKEGVTQYVPYYVRVSGDGLGVSFLILHPDDVQAWDSGKITLT